MCAGLLVWPPGRVARLGRELGGQSHDLRHEVLGCIASAALRNQVAEDLRGVGGRSWAAIAHDVGRLPEGQLADFEARGCGIEGEGRARRRAIQERLPTRL